LTVLDGLVKLVLVINKFVVGSSKAKIIRHLIYNCFMEEGGEK